MPKIADMRINPSSGHNTDARAFTRSYWQAEAHAQHDYSMTVPPASADYVIVGGGLAGLSTALQLKRLQPGCSVVVLEDKFFGFGASGRNGGLLSPLPAPLYLVSATRNPDHAWALKRLNAEVRAVANWLEEYLPRSEITAVPLRLEATSRFSECVIDELAEVLTASEIGNRIAQPARRNRRMLEIDAYMVQPYRLVRALADHASRRGVHLCEGTGVTSITATQGPDGARVTLSSGSTISARKVVVATNAYTTPDLIGERVPARVVFNYMLAVKLAPSDDDPAASPFVVELNKAYVFYRYHGGQLAYGGVEKFRGTGGSDFDVPQAIYDELLRLLPSSVGKERSNGATVTEAWGGKFHMTATDLPVIRASRNNPALILNIGYGGTGVAMTLICSKFAAATVLDGTYESPHEHKLHQIMMHTRVPIVSALRVSSRLAWRYVKSAARESLHPTRPSRDP